MPEKPVRTNIAGVYSDPEKVAEILDIASDNYNLIGAPVLGEIPIGHSVVMTVLRIPKSETFPTAQGCSLSSTALNRLASAAGVHLVQSVCVASERNLCVYQATVRRQELDGHVRTVTQSYTLDLRDNSPRIESIIAKARGKQKSPDADIREKRASIAQLAETGAYQRALRKLLSLRPYSDAELSRPFAIPKLQFTGRVPGNPQLQMAMAMKIADHALGAGQMLYGAPALPPAPAPMALLPSAPGPMARSIDEDDEPAVGDEPEPESGRFVPGSYDQAAGRAERKPPSQPPGARGAARPEPRPAPQPARGSDRGGRAPHVMKFGRASGTLITEASDADLAWYKGAVARSAEDPDKARYRRDNLAIIEEIEAELRRRSGEVDEGDDFPDNPDDLPM